MKRLFIALAAAVAVSTASAKVTDTQSFETSFSDFVPSVENVDESELVSYDNDGPGFAAPYDFDDFGLKYLKLDTGDATLWRTNASEAANVYFDMAIQFTPTAAEEEPDPTGNKIVIFMDANTNLVVISGTDATDQTPKTNRFENVVEAKSWARLTLSAMQDQGSLLFRVNINGMPISRELFSSLDNDTMVREVGFSGSGALDDFVARTTDPFIANPVVSVGGEGYASFDEALDDAGSDVTFELNANDTSSKTLASGDSIKVKLNGNTLSFASSPVAITVGDVTTYTAAYFPRTSTAGQDGSAANPYEIADVDDIAALKAAFAADANYRSKNYKLVADIDATDLGYFDGIGTASGTNGNTGLNGGTFDGAGHTIGNVKFTPAKYRGFFNQVLNSTIKDLTINVVDIQQTSAAEHGYAAFAGNMKNSQILNCRATGTLGTTAKPTMHTSAGFAVKVDSAGVFVNCTNEIDIVCSLTDNPKIGGIAGLFQGGALTNCWNSGDITITCKKCNNNGNGAGGLVGYAQTSTLKIHGGGNEGTIQSTDTTPDGGTYDIKVGTIIGMQYSSTATVTGGTVAQADAAPAGAFANISGLTYATVDNNVATFVPDAELAAGNTYVLQQDVAASGTPVYTFNAAGTIAFNTNGFNFAGTVAAGASLGVVGPVVDGSVLTYSAGVAAVDGVAYATFEAALAALEGETTDDFVTLLADVTYVLSAGETLRVKTGGHEFTPNAASDVIIKRKLQDGVVIYDAVEGVASVYHGGTTTWYETFAEAYDAAHAITTGDYPILTIKVGSDFTPEITYSQFFQQIKIVSTTESPVTVNLKNAAGTYTMTAVGYQASANVTLVLPADLDAVNNAYLTGGCTVEIPEGVTLTLAPGSSSTLSNIGGLVGAGTLVAPTDPGALYNFMANATYSSWLKADTWTGTLQCSGDMTTVNYGILFDNIANANASIRFSGFTNYIHNATSASSFEAIELVGDGLTLAGEYSNAATYTFTNTLKGDGALNVAVTGGGYGNPLKTIQFTGDVSGFGGSITFTDGATYKAHDVLIFGSDSSSVSNAVVVSAGVVMTNATGKTWNAPGGVVVNGSLVANGTVTTAAELDGSGVYEVNASTAAIKVANTWTGTYNANFKAANNAIFYIPVNASATTVINGANGEFGGYPNFGGAAPTIAGDVVLNADWTIANGWAGAGNVTTFANLSGAGDLTVDGTTSGTDPIYYTITELDNYTGTLGGARGSFTIGKVNVDDQPTNGAIVVATAIGANGSINDNVPLWVAGADTTKTLTYKTDGDGAYGAGLYYIESAPTPVTPEVTPSAGGTVDCGSAAAATAAADAINAAKATYIKAPAVAELSGEAAAAYANLFDARADGNNVVVELNAAGTNALETAATNVAAQIVTPANLASILSGTRSIRVTGAQPGFFYSVVYAANLTALATAAEGGREMANADGEVALPMSETTPGATAGFYRVLVNVVPKVSE